MKLTAAARRFDKTVATDAYDLTPTSATFKCQFDLWDDSKRDGMTIERRILSTDAAVTLPARRTVTVNGKQWMIGDGAEDYYNGEVIRIKYVGHQASGLAEIKTVEQALLGTAGHTTYAAAAWTKAAREVETSSDLTNVLTVYLSRVEPLNGDTLVLLNGKVLWTRQPYEVVSGLNACVVDELENPWETASWSSRTYDPITDAYTGANVTTPALRMKWQEHFEYFSKAQGTYERGDAVLFVLSSAGTVKPSDTVTLSDGAWKVLTVVAEGAVQSLHIRRG